MSNTTDSKQDDALEPCPFCPATLKPFPKDHLPEDLQGDAAQWFQITHNAGCYFVLLGFGDYPIHQDRLKAWNTRSRASVPAVGDAQALQRRLYDECITANWDPEKRNSFAEEIAHLHEELSEAFRAWRRYKDCEIREVNGKLEGVPIEFADALIGMFYNAELHGFDLLEAIELKHQFNLKRNYVTEGRQLHPPATVSSPSPAEPPPIDMILFCPRCGTQHVDAEQSEADYQNLMQAWSLNAEPQDRVPRRWTNPPHRSHLCHQCYAVWRPADVPTNGVARIKTRGKDDNTVDELSRGSC